MLQTVRIAVLIMELYTKSSDLRKTKFFHVQNYTLKNRGTSLYLKGYKCLSLGVYLFERQLCPLQCWSLYVPYQIVLVKGQFCTLQDIKVPLNIVQQCTCLKGSDLVLIWVLPQ